MKLQLDYDNKKITLEDNVSLKDLIPKIQKILPDWEKWTLETNTTINWVYPVVIEKYPYYPVYPAPNYPMVTYGTTGTVTNQCKGKVNY